MFLKKAVVQRDEYRDEDTANGSHFDGRLSERGRPYRYEPFEGAPRRGERQSAERTTEIE